jgi:hypothetical protein
MDGKPYHGNNIIRGSQPQPLCLDRPESARAQDLGTGPPPSSSPRADPWRRTSQKVRRHRPWPLHNQQQTHHVLPYSRLCHVTRRTTTGALYETRVARCPSMIVATRRGRGKGRPRLWSSLLSHDRNQLSIRFRSSSAWAWGFLCFSRERRNQR